MSGQLTQRQRMLEIEDWLRRTMCVLFFPRHAMSHISRPQTDSIRADDHSTIGGILFAVITPAIFWKRASKVNRECPYTVYPLCTHSGDGQSFLAVLGLVPQLGCSLTTDDRCSVILPRRLEFLDSNLTTRSTLYHCNIYTTRFDNCSTSPLFRSQDGTTQKISWYASPFTRAPNVICMEG